MKEFVSKAEERRYNRSMELKKNKPCSICKGEFTGFGNNPEPVLSYEERCCNDCNGRIVIPMRLFNMQAHGALTLLKHYGFSVRAVKSGPARVEKRKRTPSKTPGY